MPCISSLFSLRRSLTTIAPKFKYSNQTALSVLQSCKSVKEFKQLHALVLRTDRISDTFFGTKMVEFCAISARDMDYALRFFDSIDSPSAYTWTSMIRGFVTNKNPEKAIEFYSLMRMQGIEPYKFTFLFVLKAYSLIPSCQKGRIIHGKLVKLGLYFDKFLCSSLIHLYSKCGDLRSAHQLFDEVPTENLVNWNAMIVACFVCGDMERGRRLFDEMPEKNVESWNAIISGYSKLGHFDIARSLFEVMPDRDVVSWSAVISGFVQNRRPREALEVFKEMQLAGVSPDSVTMVSALSACSQIGALDMGRWIHAHVSRNKLRHDVFLGTSLVDMYAKCGCIDMAFQVFNGMPSRNLCSWNAMLSGFAMHGYGIDALALFKQMESACVQPNDVTFVAVLSACSHIGSVEEGQWQFNRMENEFHISPRIEHYGCMVDLLGRAGLIDEAKELIKRMPMEPNIVVLGALINACKLHGDTNVGEDVVRRLENLGVEDGGCYVLLSNICASMNQWDEVVKTRTVMRDVGVEEKMPGCSSIEVNSMVHEFLVGDRKHPNWREVHKTVDRICSHLDVEGYMPNFSLDFYDTDKS